jgi:hypothetical protein
VLSERFLSLQRRAELPGGRHRHSPTSTFPPPARDGCGGGSRCGVDNVMWGSDYPHSESTFPPSWKILAGVPRRTGKACPRPQSGDRRRQHARGPFDMARRVAARRRDLQAPAALYGNPRPCARCCAPPTLTISEAKGGNCYCLSFGFGRPIWESGACSTCTKTATIFMHDMTAMPQVRRG